MWDAYFREGKSSFIRFNAIQGCPLLQYQKKKHIKFKTFYYFRIKCALDHLLSNCASTCTIEGCAYSRCLQCSCWNAASGQGNVRRLYLQVNKDWANVIHATEFKTSEQSSICKPSHGVGFQAIHGVTPAIARDLFFILNCCGGNHAKAPPVTIACD